MRKMDVLNYTLAVVLVAASVPLYRLILERSRAADMRLGQSLPRADVVQVLPARLPDAPLPLQAGSEGGVQCWRGMVYRQTQRRWQVVYGPEGRPALCQIQIEPVRPQNSEASEQTP